MPVGFPDYYGGLTLPVTVAEGGTGQTSVTSKALLYGAGTSKLIETNVGTSGQYLQIDPVTLDPTFEDLSVDVSVITGILAIAHGGTGTATPGLVAGTSISVTGTWPNQTIANTSNYASLADPLPVAHGGTGTATPALTAGLNIAISGSWPGQTVATTSTITLGTASSDTDKAITIGAAAANLGQAVIGTGTQTVVGIGRKLFGISNQGQNPVFAVDTSGNVGIAGQLNLGTVLAVGYGGTGASSLAGAGIPVIVATANQTGKTSSIGSTTLLTPGVAGVFRITAEVYLNNVSGAGDSVQVGVTFHQNSNTFSTAIFTVTQGVVGKNWGSGTATIYADASTAIQYNATASLGASDSFDIHVRLEQM